MQILGVLEGLQVLGSALAASIELDIISDSAKKVIWWQQLLQLTECWANCNYLNDHTLQVPQLEEKAGHIVQVMHHSNNCLLLTLLLPCLLITCFACIRFDDICNTQSTNTPRSFYIEANLPI